MLLGGAVAAIAAKEIEHLFELAMRVYQAVQVR